jgi:hypothetical protein
MIWRVCLNSSSGFAFKKFLKKISAEVGEFFPAKGNLTEVMTLSGLFVISGSVLSCDQQMEGKATIVAIVKNKVKRFFIIYYLTR